MIGFMGCYAAINALKLARHIVRSEPSARVLILNIELCTLHLKETTDLEQVLSFLLFGDGCAACLVSADPVGTALDSFRAVLVPDTRELITWNIRDFGFDMVLSGGVPAAIHDALQGHMGDILDGAPAASDRSVGGASRRPHRARRGRARLRSRARGARRLARGAAPLWQHVVGHRDVRDRAAVARAGARPQRLRHVVRPRPDRRDHVVPHRRLSPMDLTAGRPAPVFDRARRSAQTEILDGPVETAELAKILRDLARFNGAMMGHWPVLQWLDRATRDLPPDSR